VAAGSFSCLLVETSTSNQTFLREEKYKGRATGEGPNHERKLKKVASFNFEETFAPTPENRLKSPTKKGGN
jgi:hypothetical protein